MYGTVPNPQKSFQVDKPENVVADALKHLNLYTNKFKFESANEMLKQYTFSTTEFLSLGVYIDVNYSFVSENKTQITIEVRRKVGAFDKPHEISNANRHINELSECLSLSLNSDHLATKEKIQTLIKENQEKDERRKAKNPIWFWICKHPYLTIFGLLLLWIIVGKLFGIK